jgi:nitrite reductase (NADH) large subunit
MTQYLIIGNGVAGTTAAENIRLKDKTGKITLVTDEDLPFYSRIRLNEYIAGDISEDELVIRKEQWYRDRNIDLVMSTRITGANPGGKTMSSDAGKEFLYDKLLLATGSHSFIPPIKGAETGGVFALRNVADARKIISAADEGESVVIIGGGLLGLETGNGFVKRGKSVTVVEFFPRLLPRQLDTPGAKKLQDIMEGMGFSFRLGAKTQEITGSDRAEGVALEGGEHLKADLVVISAGVRPNMELAELMGLECDKGIIADKYLSAGGGDIYVAGDAAQFGPMPYGIWPAASEQGKIAGLNMAGEKTEYTGTPMANTLKIVGIDLASAGEIDDENEHESIVVDEGTTYKKLVIEGSEIIGVIMLGQKEGFNKITSAMKEKKNISRYKGEILDPGFDFKKLD